MTARIWVLLGPHRGDNNQVIALAESLGLPFETRTLSYNLLRKLGPRRLGTSMRSLTRRSRAQLTSPWPDMVIGIGRRSVPVARWIRQQSGGKARLVRLGNPEVDTGAFDLVLTTPQYPVEPADNVVRLPLVISRYRKAPASSSEEEAFLAALPRPHLLLALGGPTKFWELPPERVVEAATRLSRRAKSRGGSLIVVPSPRTEAETQAAVKVALGGRGCFIEDRKPRFPVLLADADEIFVTGDSVSMVSEAILTGKPVGMIPIELSRSGRRRLGASIEDGAGKRDLRRFWKSLEDAGLIGTTDAPVSSTIENPVGVASAEVLRLLRR